MEYTPAQKEEIQRAYGARRQRQLIMTIPMLLVIFALIFSSDSHSERIMGMRPEVFSGLMAAVVLIFVVLSFRNWRCPGCSKYLGRNFNPRFCSRCGVQLHD